MKVVALSAGTAKAELEVEQSGHEALLFCEIDSSAHAVSKRHFPNVFFVSDVRIVKSPSRDTELVTAGFLRQDLSQTGRREEINGSKSSVAAHSFRLLCNTKMPNFLVENVLFMHQLKKDQAVHYLVDSLEKLSYKWAYRVVDALALAPP
jgi:DNA (cytosine-5)-methyltransferase 1